MNIDPADSRLSWYGAISFERGDGWLKPWRIPYDQRLLFGKTSAGDRMLTRAGMPSGVRIVFHSDTETVEGQVEPCPAEESSGTWMQDTNVDLACDGVLHETLSLGTGSNFRFEGLPKREKLLELWLPCYREIRLRTLGLSNGATVHPYEDSRPRWLAYGCSYTQGRSAGSPFYTWPAVAARKCNLNHINLGYGGGCHLDPMIARMMRDMPADFISMDVGVNIYGHETLSERTFRANLIGFIEILRERHRDTPLAVASAIYGWEQETTPNALKLTLADTREIVREAVEALQACGDACIHYFSGLDLIGAPEKDLLGDHVHPNAEGYKLLGERFAARVITKFLPAARAS